MWVIAAILGYLLGCYANKWSKESSKQKDLWQPVMKKNLK